MVGAAVCRRLQREPQVEVITRTRQELDLCDERQVVKFFEAENQQRLFLRRLRWVGFMRTERIRWNFCLTI